MPTESRRYAKLLKAQKLVKERDEAVLNNAVSMRTNLAEEDNFLFSVMDNETTSRFFDPLMVANRLESNARKEAILDNSIVKLRQALLESSRRYDAIDEKRKVALETEERKDLAKMLEEYVAARIVKDTSLG